LVIKSFRRVGFQRLVKVGESLRFRDRLHLERSLHRQWAEFLPTGQIYIGSSFISLNQDGKLNFILVLTVEYLNNSPRLTGENVISIWKLWKIETCGASQLWKSKNENEYTPCKYLFVWNLGKLPIKSFRRDVIPYLLRDWQRLQKTSRR